MSPVAPQLGATKELISFIQHLPFVIMQWQTVTCFSWEHVWLHHGSCGWRWRARCRPAIHLQIQTLLIHALSALSALLGAPSPPLHPWHCSGEPFRQSDINVQLYMQCAIQQHIMLRMKSSSWISYTNVEDHFHYTLYLVPLCKVFSDVIKTRGNGRIFFICLFC